jgi:hypothetical protein
MACKHWHWQGDARDEPPGAFSSDSDGLRNLHFFRTAPGGGSCRFCPALAMVHFVLLRSAVDSSMGLGTLQAEMFWSSLDLVARGVIALLVAQLD